MSRTAGNLTQRRKGAEKRRRISALLFATLSAGRDDLRKVERPARAAMLAASPTESTGTTAGVAGRLPAPRAWSQLCVISALVARVVLAATGPAPVVSQHMVLLEPAGDQLIVRESLIVHNAGDAPFRDPQNGAVRIFVPDAGMESLGVTAIPPGKPSVQQQALKTNRPQEYKVDFTLPPGDTRFDFAYTVPFQSPGPFVGRVLHTGGPVNLVVPRGVSARGDGLELVGQEPQSGAVIYAIKLSQYKVELEGAASMEAAGADDSGPSLDEIHPRLYDNLLAILGLAFAILALGFVLLYRNPRVPS